MDILPISAGLSMRINRGMTYFTLSNLTRMMQDDHLNKKIHEGHNIKRFREMLGIKQEALALALGDDWNQKKVSLLEGKDTIDPDILEQVAGVLKVPAKAIQNFDEEGAVAYINTFYDSSKADFNYNCTFNPIEKIVQLYDEKITLYERMLRDKDDMIARVEKMNTGKA